MWKLKNEYNINMYWPGMMTAHRAGSRACSWLNFFALFFPFFCSKKLSQLQGAEPATRHWASYVALSQQRGNGESVLYGTDGFSDAAFAVPTNQIIDKFWHRQSIHIYIYVYIYNPNRIIMVNLRQHQFSWGRRVPLSWREIGKSNFRLARGPHLTLGYIWDT